jgi:hypothetical protein
LGYWTCPKRVVYEIKSWFVSYKRAEDEQARDGACLFVYSMLEIRLLLEFAELNDADAGDGRYGAKISDCFVQRGLRVLVEVELHYG